MRAVVRMAGEGTGSGDCFNIKNNGRDAMKLRTDLADIILKDLDENPEGWKWDGECRIQRFNGIQLWVGQGAGLCHYEIYAPHAYPLTLRQKFRLHRILKRRGFIEAAATKRERLRVERAKAEAEIRKLVNQREERP